MNNFIYYGSTRKFLFFKKKKKVLENFPPSIVPLSPTLCPKLRVRFGEICFGCIKLTLVIGNCQFYNFD